ncbi:MAG: hypothetical protein R2911_01710 [Caldilineaceae bacterium]
MTHAVGAIAPAVAEMTITLILLSLRQVHVLDRQMKVGLPWREIKASGLAQESRAIAWAWWVRATPVAKRSGGSRRWAPRCGCMIPI